MSIHVEFYVINATYGTIQNAITFLLLNMKFYLLSLMMFHSFVLTAQLPIMNSIFPFGSVENETLLNLFDFDKPSAVDSLPSFQITSRLTNLPNYRNMILMTISPLILILAIILFKIYLLLTFLPLIFPFYT